MLAKRHYAQRLADCPYFRRKASLEGRNGVAAVSRDGAGQDPGRRFDPPVLRGSGQTCFVEGTSHLLG